MDQINDAVNEENLGNGAITQVTQSGLSVAYHAGPPSIGFCGRQWQRDVAQPVTPEEWKAMQARGDFDEFNFTKEK